MSWLGVNRLKVFSLCAVTGDLLTGLGGASAHMDGGRHAWLLMFGSMLALAGHAVLLLWGKGARDARIAHAAGSLDPVHMRPFIPWRYPMDTGFCVFAFSAMAYWLWGIFTGNWPMMAVGLLLFCASLIGWLVPAERRFFGLRAVQVTAAMYIAASVNTLLAGIWADNWFIIASSCIYGFGNAVLFTTRKEHQSAYTQSHG